MNIINKHAVFIFLLAIPAAVANAQAPRKQLSEMTALLKKTPGDAALREKLIKLAVTLKPAPAIPESAREPFVMGARVLKKSGDAAGALKAVELFTQAVDAAPWYADAYYNRALARETAGQLEPAIDDVKLYLMFKLSADERRGAQDKIYALKADAQLASGKRAEQDKIDSAAAAQARTEQAKRDVIVQIKNAVRDRRYNSAMLSHSKDSGFAGVNEHELNGGGEYYQYGNYDYYVYFWKFYDDHLEVWVTSDNGYQHCYVRGESMGPTLADMRWFNGCTPGSNAQSWGKFDPRTARLFVSIGGRLTPRPISDSEFDPNRRYSYTRYAPPD